MTTAPTTDPLLGRFDVLLVDLDGTLVLAGHRIDHAAEALDAARAAGVATYVVTNNASRTATDVVASLAPAGFDVAADHVISSPLAAAALLADRHEPGSAVLVLGASALAQAVRDAGLNPVTSADASPVAVVQGYDPDTGWRELGEACIAIRAGADWVATNTDSTLPTDRGLLPGNGAMVQALVTATDRHPTVAGKPDRALLDLAVAKSGRRAPLVIGDRLGTDIAAAAAAGMPSLMVLTGVSTTADVLDCDPRLRPTYVATDLRGLTDPGRYITVADHPDDAALAAALTAVDPA